MKIITAWASGMCFGVRDALTLMRRLEAPAAITVNGRLVHNPLVTRELQARGFEMAEEGAEAIPRTPAVLITAHGISDRQRARLAQAGKHLIDATCPLVKRAHRAALQLQAQAITSS